MIKILDAEFQGRQDRKTGGFTQQTRNSPPSGANTAAIKDYNEDHQKRIKIRQCKYLNNIVEQDHRRVKRRCRAMLGFKNFDAAQKTLAGIELIHMIKKGQMRATRGNRLSPAAQFYGLAA